MNGTLGAACRKQKPRNAVHALKWPRSLREVRFDEEGSGKRSKTTTVISFDTGWSVKMRIHNKDSRVSNLTAPAWDINIEGLPANMMQEKRRWTKI